MSVAELVEHPRLWSYMLPGCEEHWLAAARPRMQALLEAQLGADTPDVRARGLAIDAILSLPAHSEKARWASQLAHAKELRGAAWPC